MIEEMTDPSGPLTEIDHQILALKKLLRPAAEVVTGNVDK